MSHLPPQPCVHGRASSQHATRHLVRISARNAGRVHPDLVAETGHVEPGQLRAVQPLRPHGTAPLPRGFGPLLDEQHRVPRLAQLVRHGDTAGATADDDVIPRLVRGDGLARHSRRRGRDTCCRGGIASWSSASTGRGRRRRLGRQLRVVRVSSRSGVRKRGAILPKQAAVVRDGDLVGAARVAGRLVGGGAAQDRGTRARRDTALGAVLVPDEAVLAAVDDLEGRVVDRRRQGREGRVAGVARRLRVPRGEAERGEDLVSDGPCHQEQRRYHLARLAVGQAAVCCACS